MSAPLSIGDFARATHLTVKTLRHYHEVGLLEPAEVDAATGYRRYAVEQIPVAQVIRRLRDLSMPLPEIRHVLATTDPHTRNERIAAHLRRLEDELGRTQAAVAGLRDLLTSPASADPTARIELRNVPEVRAAGISDVVDAGDAVPWLHGALGELRATLAAHHVDACGPAGGLYPDELFTRHRGEVTIFIPCAEQFRPTGRVTTTVVPATELAVIEHRGEAGEVDRAYGVLAAYVARHALVVEGPIREYYVVGQHDTADATQWRTEIGWPIFRTACP